MLQADAYGGYGKLYEGERKPAPIIEATCWAHARRKFLELADIEGAARQRAQKRVAAIAPLALETVRRMDDLFAIEREVNCHPAAERLAVRRERSAPIVAALSDLDAYRARPPAAWLRSGPGHGRHARSLAVLRPLPRRPAHVHDQRRGRAGTLRGLALGRKAWLSPALTGASSGPSSSTA